MKDMDKEKLNEEKIKEYFKNMPFLIIRTENTHNFFTKLCQAYDKIISETDTMVIEELVGSAMFLGYIIGKNVEKVSKIVQKQN